MKTNEERCEEINEPGSIVTGSTGARMDASTGENARPECGSPTYQVREDDMNCPNCGVLLLNSRT